MCDGKPIAMDLEIGGFTVATVSKYMIGESHDVYTRQATGAPIRRLAPSSPMQAAGRIFQYDQVYVPLMPPLQQRIGGLWDTVQPLLPVHIALQVLVNHMCFVVPPSHGHSCKLFIEHAVSRGSRAPAPDPNSNLELKPAGVLQKITHVTGGPHLIWIMDRFFTCTTLSQATSTRAAI